MNEQVWQLFILGTGNLDQALKKGLGGVIFFTKDINSESDFRFMINDIKNKASIPPFLSIDQEGGRVERTEAIRPKRLSAKYAFQEGLDFLEKQSDEISKELTDFGINLNFAPCIDVNTNPKNPIIGERSFSSDPNDVIKAMQIFQKASEKFGVIPCVKHYPGHGDASQDSHLTLPQIDLSLEEMELTHIKPFKAAIDNGIEMIMAAHLHCTCFDKKTIPSSLSKNAINYLRNYLKYNGIIISDDMEMKGVAGYGKLESVIMGLKAGLDMFIFRESDNETLEMIENLCELVAKDKELEQLVIQANMRIHSLKNKWL